MVKLFISLAIILGSSVQVLAQDNEITFTERVKRTAGDLIYADESQLLYCTYAKLCAFPYARTFFRVAVGSSEMEKTVIGAEMKDGGREMPYNYAVVGDVMFELVNHKVGVTNTFSVLKRDLKTLEVLKRMDNVYSKKSASGAGLSIGLSASVDGVFLYSDGKKFKKYTHDFEFVWESEIPEFKDDVRCGHPQIQDNGVLISNIYVWSGEGSSTVGYNIWKKNGESFTIQPELEESFNLRRSKYYYDETKDEFIGVFLSSDNFDEENSEKDATSFVMYKWNSDGEILKNGKHTFKFKDFYGKSNGEVDKIFEKLKIKSKAQGDDYLSRIDANDVDFDFRGDGSVLVSYNFMKYIGTLAPVKWKRELEELHMSSFLFSISPDGELEWSRLIAREKDGIHYNVSCVFGSRNVYYLTREFNNSISNGAYTFQPRKRQLITAETVSPTITSVDLDDQTVEMKLEKGTNYVKGDEFLESQVFDDILIYNFKCAKGRVMYGIRKFD